MENKIIKAQKKRKRAGRKPKYDEDTTTFAFRCPISKLDYMKKLIRKELSAWELNVYVEKTN